MINTNNNTIKFIGTGSGKVSLKRFHSAFILTSRDYKLLVDCGDAISRALISAGENITEINSILISHFHPDHLNGISLLLIQMKMAKRNLPLQIFVHQKLKERLNNFLITSMIFFERYNFDINIIGFDGNTEINLNEKFSFTAKENSHVEEYKKDAPENYEMISCSFLFNIDDKKLFYTADIAAKEDLYLFEGNQIDLIISEVTHIALNEIIKAFEKFNSEKLIFTHISDDDESKVYSFLNTFNSVAEKIFSAKDGMVIKI